MKNKTLEYTAAGDAVAIICDLVNAGLHITPTQENELKITCNNAKGLHISCKEGVLTVKQSTRTHLFTSKKTIINVYVPDHTLPDITVNARSCSADITSGIYGRFTLSCDNGTAELRDCSFADCELTGDNLSTYLKGVTVKNTLAVQCGAGDMIWENSFASCTQCRVKRGNIGLSGFNCINSVMQAENGNVAASLKGKESDYSLGLLIKEGISNKESVKREGAARSFKAYSAKGNIAIDFVRDEDYAYGES